MKFKLISILKVFEMCRSLVRLVDRSMCVSLTIDLCSFDYHREMACGIERLRSHII